MHDGGDDAEFSFGEAFAHPRSHQVFIDFSLGGVRPLEEGLALRKPSHRFQHDVAAGRAVDHSLHTHAHEVGGVLVIIGEHQYRDLLP